MHLTSRLMRLKIYALFTYTLENYKNIKFPLKNRCGGEHFQRVHEGLEENDSF